MVKFKKLPKLGAGLELVKYSALKDNTEVNYYPDGVQAGFPSPADDFKEEKLSLDKRYLTNPDSTYIVKVKGNSMYPTLHVGDLLIVKSDLSVNDNNIIIVSVNNTDFTVKRFDKANSLLIADNPDFNNIQIGEEDELINLGVVKHIIRDI